MPYKYLVTSSVPLHALNNGGQPAIIMSPESTLEVGESSEFSASEGWGFDLTLERVEDED